MTSKRFFPLDEKLRLRADHWSGGAARVAVRQGLQAKSFKLAAASFSDATGCAMSGEAMRQVTQGWGEVVDKKRKQEVGALFDPSINQTVEIEVFNPVVKQASLSTDGGYMFSWSGSWLHKYFPHSFPSFKSAA